MKIKNAIVSWLHKTWARNFPRRQNPFYGQMLKVRLAQCVQFVALHGRGIAVALFGDSRLHEFENQINAVQNWICLAMSGAKTENYLDAIRQMMDILDPQKVVTDIGGNNFNAGYSLEEVEDLEKKLFAKLKGFNDFYMEIPYLGTHAATAVFPGSNQKIAGFNSWLWKTVPKKVIRLVDVLSPQGFLDPQYNCGDDVHFSPAAWPVMKQRIEAA